MNGSDSNTSGDNVAVREWTGTPKHVSQPARDEILRDFQISWERKTADSDIWSGTTEPTDKTKIWWPKDPVSGTRIGQPKYYDTATGTWVALGTDSGAAQARKRANGEKAVVAGASIVSISFDGIASDNYKVTITPSTKQEDGTYGPSPANMNNFGWCIVAMATGQFQVQLFAVPTGGLTLLWEVEELEGATV